MFCLTAIRACRPWPSVVAAVTKRQGLNTRSLTATAVTQAQSGIKKRAQRRKPAVLEDTGQRQGVSRRYFSFYHWGGGCIPALWLPVGPRIEVYYVEELNLTI